MPKHVLGIEFGTQNLTMVQLTGSVKAYSVVTAVQQPLPYHADPEERLALLRQALQELLHTQRLRADTVVTTLPAHKAVLRNLEVPFKDPRRIRPTIKYVLEEHMPFEPDDVVADFYMLPLPSNGATQLLIAAMPQQVIAEHLTLLQSVGLEPTIVDLDALALANAALLGCEILETHAVLVDLAPTRTLLTMLHNGTPIFTRSLPHGLLGADLAAATERLSKHLQHTLYACEHALKQPYEPHVLLLSGEGGAHLAHLAATLENALGIPARVWQLTSEHYRPGKVALPPDDQTRYAVAFGAAVRGLHRQAIGLNLRRERFELHGDLQELRGRLIGLGIMLVFVAGLGLGSLYLDNRLKTQRLVQLRTEIARVFGETLPGTRMVQATLQVREKVRELEDRLRAFGGVTGAQLSGLRLLREISARVPASITVNVDSLLITTDATDLSGTTTSYDDVVKLKEALEGSSFFTSVKIGDMKADADNKIRFKLTITTTKMRETTS
jgi:Tfp pilus assembly PilM family ATPase/Tfp pilus assembly protein PilN